MPDMDCGRFARRLQCGDALLSFLTGDDVATAENDGGSSELSTAALSELIQDALGRSFWIRTLASRTQSRDLCLPRFDTIVLPMKSMFGSRGVSKS